MMSEYQLIVIGAGPGGYMAALQGAKHGLKTAVVEAREAGGTCLNRGCIPTKTLLHSSEIFSAAKNAEHAGIKVSGIEADIPAIFANKKQVSETLSAGIEGLFKKAKVDLIRGKATITAADCIDVTDAEGNVTAYTADNILIATGSVPAMPLIPGLDLDGVMNSDALLEGADHLYESIVIIGGGVIGVEFATFFSELGTKVTVIEGLDRLLPNLDKELGQNLAQLLKKQGVSICTGAMVKEVRKAEGGLEVIFTAKNAENSAVGEVVLCAIGRRPYTEGLFVPGLEIEMKGRSIAVDENFETSIKGVYAIGDVSAKIQLAHVATAQGIACVDHIAGKKSEVDLSIVPSCIYCRPEIASVGMTDAEAKAAGINAKVGKCVMHGNGRTLIAGAGRSFMKVVANADTREIIGAQMMCVNSTDMISQLSEAIANHLTAADLLRAMRPHPTFEEALTEALEDLEAKLG
ncbi:MAG: dihydrolipoyl dehydrogenase [Clostridiales bacterium]|nr:dihydrolipoyl dehydrogenase [Clostridiales bacterium]